MCKYLVRTGKTMQHQTNEIGMFLKVEIWINIILENRDTISYDTHHKELVE